MKILVCRNEQRARLWGDKNGISYAEAAKNVIVVHTDNERSIQRLNGLQIGAATDIHFFSDWDEGKYAVAVKRAIMLRLKPGQKVSTTIKTEQPDELSPFEIEQENERFEMERLRIASTGRFFP